MALDISDFPDASNGGCSIVSYDYQRDDGLDGAFTTLVGLSSPYLMQLLTVSHTTETPIVRSRVYRYRYRARNCVGWGPLSDELHVLAADVPTAPPSPTVSSTSALQIALLLYPTTDNGGSVVTDYALLRNDGADGSTYTAISSYSYAANGFQHTVVLAGESMTAGLYYQFVYRATNAQGVSADSDVVTLPVADAPAQPASAPALVNSTKTSVTVSWEKATDTQTPAGTTTGHYLYMDDGAQGDFSLVFSGEGYPDLVEYTVDGGLIETGLPYRFYVVSENYVGLSTSASDIAEFRACLEPSGLAAPTSVSTTDTSVSISWSAPVDDGGCALTGYAVLVGDEDVATSGGVTYSEVHSAEVRDDPSMSTFTVSEIPGTASAGSNLRFKLMAFNEGGFSVTST